MVDRGNLERLVGRSGGGRGGGGAHVVALFGGSATAMVGKHIHVLVSESRPTTIGFGVGLLEINGIQSGSKCDYRILSVRRMSEIGGSSRSKEHPSPIRFRDFPKFSGHMTLAALAFSRLRCVFPASFALLGSYFGSCFLFSGPKMTFPTSHAFFSVRHSRQVRQWQCLRVSFMNKVRRRLIFSKTGEERSARAISAPNLTH